MRKIRTYDNIASKECPFHTQDGIDVCIKECPLNKQWWHKKANEMFFVEDYNNQDKFDAGIEALVIESTRLERGRIIKMMRLALNNTTPEQWANTILFNLQGHDCKDPNCEHCK